MTTVRALPVLAAIVWTTATASAATITGTVIGEGARPIAGATVFVVGALPPCTTTSGPDGIFSFSCAATGPHAVRATFGDLRPWQVDDIALAPDADVHLNFMLLPATAPTPPSSTAPVGPPSPASGRGPFRIRSSRRGASGRSRSGCSRSSSPRSASRWARSRCSRSAAASA